MVLRRSLRCSLLPQLCCPRGRRCTKSGVKSEQNRFANSPPASSLSVATRPQARYGATAALSGFSQSAKTGTFDGFKPPRLALASSMTAVYPLGYGGFVHSWWKSRAIYNPDKTSSYSPASCSSAPFSAMFAFQLSATEYWPERSRRRELCGALVYANFDEALRYMPATGW